MYFTQDDYLKIQKWLSRNSVRDTEFQEANTPFKGNETVTLVQNGHNRKVFISDLTEQIFALGTTDFLNVSEFSKEYNITLDKAITLIPPKSRKSGQVISFNNEDGNWEIYQFTGNVNQWATIDLWKDIISTLEVKVEIPDESIIGLPLGKVVPANQYKLYYPSEMEVNGTGDTTAGSATSTSREDGEIWVLTNYNEDERYRDIFAYVTKPTSEDGYDLKSQYNAYINPNLKVSGLEIFTHYNYDSTVYHCEENNKKYSFNNSRKIQEVFPKKSVSLQEAIDDIYAKLKLV